MQLIHVTAESCIPESFLDLPHQIYAGDMAWIPESRQGVRRQFKFDNPWFEQGEAVVAVADGKARVAGFFSSENRITGEPVAYFGFWETINDLETNQQLFRAIEDWAREKGAKRLYGPINFSTFGAYRVRTGGFEQGAFPGEPYNPSYYSSLMEGLGFQTNEDLNYLSFPVDIPAFLEATQREYNALRRRVTSQLKIEQLTADIWLDKIDEFYGLIDQIFGQNFAYTPLSREQFKSAMGASFAEKLCPLSSMIAWGKQGEIAGFFLAFPDYGPLMNLGAEPNRMDQVSFTNDFPKLPHPRTMLLKTVGTHPNYRRFGLGSYLGLEGCRLAQDKYERVIAALLKSDNPSTNFPRRHIQPTRTYALYTKSLQP